MWFNELKPRKDTLRWDSPADGNSYQTPNGVVAGIQWVPAEATQILPAGAKPAGAVGVRSDIDTLSVVYPDWMSNLRFGRNLLPPGIADI
jgi:hypothetical protein